MPILEKYSANQNTPEFITAKKMLDDQLISYQKIHNYNDIMLIDENGKLIFATNQSHQLNIHFAELEKELLPFFAKAKNQVYISPILKYQNKVSNIYDIMTISSVSDGNGKFIGYIILETDLEPIYKILQEKLALGETGENLLVQKQGNYVLFLSPLKFEPNAAFNKKILLGSLECCLPGQKAVTKHNGSGLELDYRKVKTLSAWRYIPEIDWGFVTKIDASEAFAAIYNLRRLAWFLELLTIIIGYVVALTITKSISDPIQALHEGTEKIGEGNFDYKVAIDTNDEIGQLSRSFDEMVVKLKRITASRNDLNEEINKRVFAEEQKTKVLYSLNKRMQEINTLYGLTKIIEKSDDSLDLICEELVNIIPGGWRFPEVTCARINLFDKEYKTLNFLDTNWKQMIDITFDGKKCGSIEVCYITEKPLADEGPFLKEERVLLGALGERLEKVIERILVHKELVLAKTSAEAANKAKSEFISAMSHELRTPLNAIIGFSEVLTDESYGPLNPKQKEYVGDVLTSGKHLLSLINDILDLAKIEAGKMELKLGEINIPTVIDNSLIMIREKAFAHKIELSKNIDLDVSNIIADERKVKQIIFNLLSNAAKFTPDGGKIGIEAKKTANNEIMISVWDTGIGIEEKDKGKIFEEFKQIEGDLNRKYPGTGLGLALTKKLVELHGGKIWFESEGKDKGCKFYFTLPIEAKELQKDDK